MAKVAGLEVVLTINGKNVSFGADALASIVSDLPDDSNSLEIHAELAKSTSYEIRENVASKDNLDEATVALLAADSIDEVICNLLCSDAAKYITQDALDKIIAKNTKLAARVADSLGRFEELDTAKLCDALATSPDPLVRRNVANNYDAPKKVLKSLLKDGDFDVVAAAKRSLE